MERRSSSLLVLAPLLVLGSLAAHAAAYLGSEPDAHRRAALLARTGHAYLSWTPSVLGTAALVLLVGLALRLLEAARGVGAQNVPATIVVLPVAGFVVQEVVERAASSGVSPALVTSRPFELGVVLQVAFGLVALVAGHLLVRGAEELGRFVVRRRTPAPGGCRLLPRLTPADPLRPRPLCLHTAGRGPPPSSL